MVAALLAVGATLTPGLSGLAQETGGSFGGGDFGGGGGSDYVGGGGYGSGGGGSDYGGSSSDTQDRSSDHDYGESSYDSGGGGGHDPETNRIVLVYVWLPALGILAAILLYAYIRHSLRRSGRSTYARSSPPAGSRAWGGTDVTSIQLAMDWRARRVVQPELMRMAQSGLTGTKHGLAQLCRRTARLLLSVEIAWLYSGRTNYQPMNPPQAESAFRRIAAGARARFEHEVVRADGGQKAEQTAPEVKARADEGPGVVVVTFVVAARRELLDIGSPRSADQIRAALSALAEMKKSDIVAIEVIWSPALDEDRMSTAELEELYPELSKLDERSVAGRVFCDHCTAPFAAEIRTCPHCGAPRAPD